MSSKVTAKLRLGAAFSVLLISLTLLAGCKQEADNSYAPPGYGSSIGVLTDTTWRNGSNIIRFGAEGRVEVPSFMNKVDIKLTDLSSDSTVLSGTIEVGDFTYSYAPSEVTIYAKVKKANLTPAGLTGQSRIDEFKEGNTVDIATLTVKTTTTNYYEMDFEYTNTNTNTTSTYAMENKPTTGDNFVGTYYNTMGIKSVQINKDGTFVQFSNGGQTVGYWKDKNDGTIYVKSTQFDNSSNEFSGGSTYYLYAHALMSGYSAKAWK